MTKPASHTAERAKEKLWVTDHELVCLMGVEVKAGLETLRLLDMRAGSGFPRKKKMWGDRRYLPAVLRYWENENEPRVLAPRHREAS